MIWRIAQRVGKFSHWALVGFTLAFLFVAPSAAQNISYKVSPTTFEWGKIYNVTVLHPDSGCSPGELKDATLVSPAQPDIEIDKTKIEATDNCKLFAEVKIADKGISGSFEILVQKGGKTQGTIPIQVVPAAPGAIPPGLKPQVDVLWSVLPWDVVVDNFGHGVANKYYCVEVVIGNNSGYSLQIASVGFDLNNKVATPELEAQFRWPSSSYLITRATLERRHQIGPRATLLHAIKAIGFIATGMIPFFKAPGPHANFATGVDIYNDPFQKGFEAVFPDTTISQLLRLDATILRDDIIVPNNTQRRTLVFFPTKTLEQEVGKQKPDFDPTDIKEALGNLVLVGDTLQYLNRVRVLSGGQPENPTPPPTTKSERFTVREGEKHLVVIEGAGLLQAEVKSEIADFVKCGLPDRNGGSIACEVDGTKAAPGEHKALLSTQGGKKELYFEVLPMPPEVDPSNSACTTLDDKELRIDSVAGKFIKCTVTGNHLLQAEIQPVPGTSAEKVFERGDFVEQRTDTRFVQKLKVQPGVKEEQYQLQVSNKGGVSPKRIVVTIQPKAP